MQRKGRRPRSDAGFGLIEAIVVVVITAMLAAITGPKLMNALGGARSSTAQLQIKSLEAALDLYRMDTGTYPNGTKGLSSLIKNPGNVRGWRGPYMDGSAIPLDPWGAPFLYKVPGEHAAFDIISLGADKARGGTGEDADVTSSNN